MLHFICGTCSLIEASSHSLQLSFSDPGPVVHISHGVFYSCLKTFLFQNLSLHSHVSLAQAHLLEYDQSVFGSHWQW